LRINSFSTKPKKLSSPYTTISSANLAATYFPPYFMISAMSTIFPEKLEATKLGEDIIKRTIFHGAFKHRADEERH